MINNRYTKYLLITILFIWSIVSAVQNGGDFSVFMHAATRLRHHGNIYAQPYFSDCLKYFYSPLFALLLVPFTYIPEFIVEALWLMFSFYLLWRIWTICESYFYLKPLTGKLYRQWVSISFFFVLTFILYNISMIQMTVFILWATLQSIQLAEKKKHMAAGALLAVAINIKILPLVFIPYLLYRGYGKSFAATLLFSMVYLFIPALVIGYNYNNELLISWWYTINPTGGEHLLEMDINLHSIVSTVPIFLSNAPNETHININFANYDVTTIERISNIIRVFFIMLILYFLRSLPFRKAINRIHTFWECCYLLLVTPLIFPHQNKYAYLYLFPTIIYIVYYCIIGLTTPLRKKYIPWLIYLLVISIVFTPLIGRDVIGNYLFDLIQLARIQVICTMLLVIPLAVFTPVKLLRSQNDAIL